MRVFQDEKKQADVEDCMRAVEDLPPSGSMQELADACVALAEAQEADPNVQGTLASSSRASASTAKPAPRQRTIEELHRNVERQDLDVLVCLYVLVLYLLEM